MAVIQSQKREAVTNNQLRSSGIIPAVLYGKSLDASISVQLTESDIMHFLRQHNIGARVDIKLDTDTYSTVLKDIARDPVNYKVQHVDFQVITADEKVNTSAVIHFINREDLPADAVFQEMHHELPYTAKPKDFVESIDIDLAGLGIGDEIKLEDLDIAKNPNVDVNLPLDTVIAVISHAKVEVEPEEGEEVEESAEVPVIGEETEK